MRYILIDYLHLAYKTHGLPTLSCSVENKITHQREVVITTIPNFTIKGIYTMSGKGAYPTAVCLEGGKSKRKSYFTGALNGGQEYKSGRAQQAGPFYRGINLSVNLLSNSDVSCYRLEGYEADDMLYALVQQIKRTDTKTPIDIITNDNDLLPLVDEQVSVYIRSSRTVSKQGCPELKGYYQVTPNIGDDPAQQYWTDYFYYSSDFKGYEMPYNAVLLFKLLKGDKSDKITGAAKGYGAVKWNAKIEEMIEGGFPFHSLMRYGKHFDEIAPHLAKYFDINVIEKMRYIYNGVNMESLNLYLPKMINIPKLQQNLLELQIRLIK